MYGLSAFASKRDCHRAPQLADPDALGPLAMLNLQRLMIDPFVDRLTQGFRQQFGASSPEYRDILAWAGHLALENISNSDALYHNVDHTMMVSLVGQEILRGKHLNEGGMTPRDWTHFLIACLCHDIGYVRGVCRRDQPGCYATGPGDGLVEIADDGTDAALTQWHVDRGKLFIRERFMGNRFLDAETISDFIEMTRFPIPEGSEASDMNSLGGLMRAADFIGQLGDPNYLRNLPRLYYEYHELGKAGNDNPQGYVSPGAMRQRFASFYWQTVSPYIQPALKHLRVTQEGKEWIASLYSHVFEVEHNI